MDKMCTYCAKWMDASQLTPLYEKNKDTVSLYCDRCLPDVKYNISTLHFKHLFAWGDKGECLE